MDNLQLDCALSYLNEGKVTNPIELLSEQIYSEIDLFNSITESVVINESNIKEAFKTLFEKIKKIFKKFINFIKIWFSKAKTKVRELIDKVREIRDFIHAKAIHALHMDDYIDDLFDFDDFEDSIEEIPASFEYVILSDEKRTPYDSIDKLIKQNDAELYVTDVLILLQKDEDYKAFEHAKNIKEIFDNVTISGEYVTAAGDFDKDMVLIEKALNMFNKELPILENRKNAVSNTLKKLESFDKKSADSSAENYYKAVKVCSAALTSEMNMYTRVANSMYSDLSHISSIVFKCSSKLINNEDD